MKNEICNFLLFLKMDFQNVLRHVQCLFRIGRVKQILSIAECTQRSNPFTTYKN